MKHKLVRESQHGFVRGKYCLTNLRELWGYDDQRQSVDLVYLDFAKAFWSASRVSAWSPSIIYINDLDIGMSSKLINPQKQQDIQTMYFKMLEEGPQDIRNDQEK